MRGPLRSMSRRATLVTLTVVACASCATSRTTTVKQEYAVTGNVTAGPVCPVVRDPPDPACADRPVPNAAITITRSDGDAVGRVVSDSAGTFAISLPAGDYTLTPQPMAGYMGTPAAQSVTAGPTPVELAFAYDTGIR